MSILGSLVNTTSRLIHNRRHNISNRVDEGGNVIKLKDGDAVNRSKSIGFADNLDMLGRWNDDLRENERTSHFSKTNKKHPQKRKWRIGTSKTEKFLRIKISQASSKKVN